MTKRMKLLGAAALRLVLDVQPQPEVDDVASFADTPWLEIFDHRWVIGSDRDRVATDANKDVMRPHGPLSSSSLVGGGFGSVFQCSVILVLHDEFFLEPVGEQRHEILLHEFEINLKNVGKIGEYVVD